MATLFNPLVEFWKRLSIGQRAGLVMVAAVALAIVAAAVNYTTRPVLVPLYTGLNAKDASQIVDDLRGEKVPFAVSGDGGTVKVPQEQVSELRLKFAGKGLPRSGELGYELFDKPMLGMSEFVQRMNYHRALEGELARTIAELDAVESARVHLVVPHERLFREDQKPATASIVVQLRPGASLAPQQVQSIAYMTAFSVEGLNVENITVTDTRGNLLTNARSRDDAVGLTSTQLEVQRSIEAGLERKALALLENALGPGRAQVKVTASLNWDRVERTVESYDADRAATLSEERQETSGEGGTGGSSERSITNYQVPHTVEKYLPEVGDIERLSASVLIDGDYRMQKGADGKETRTYVERTPQEIEKFRSLVASAIGYDSRRKDELTVISYPFSVPESTPVPDQGSILLKILEKVLLALVVIALFFVLRSVLLRLTHRIPATDMVLQPALAAGTAPMALSSGGAALSARDVAASATETAAALRGALASDSIEGGTKVIFKQTPQTLELEDTAPSMDAIKHQELLKRTREYIISKPDSATQVLRSWILDESS